jgi:hypothetical protein
MFSMGGRLLVTLALLFGSVDAISQPERSSNPDIRAEYLGTLRDASGRPVRDGRHRITLRIFASAEGGEPEWTRTVDVTTNKGAFRTRLEDPSASPRIGLLRDAYIAVQRDGDPQTKQRERLAWPVGAIPFDTLRSRPPAAAALQSANPAIIERMRRELEEFRNSYRAAPSGPIGAPPPPARPLPSFGQAMLRFQAALRDQTSGSVHVQCIASPCALWLDVDGDRQQDMAVQVASTDGKLGVALQLATERIEVIGAGSRRPLPSTLKSFAGWTVVPKEPSAQLADQRGEAIRIPAANTQRPVLVYRGADGLRTLQR